MSLLDGLLMLWSELCWVAIGCCVDRATRWASHRVWVRIPFVVVLLLLHLHDNRSRAAAMATLRFRVR